MLKHTKSTECISGEKNVRNERKKHTKKGEKECNIFSPENAFLFACVGSVW